MAPVTLSSIAQWTAIVLAATQCAIAAPPPSNSSPSQLEYLPAPLADYRTTCPYDPTHATEQTNENTTFYGSVSSRVWPRAACSLTQQLRRGATVAIYQAEAYDPASNQAYWIAFAARQNGGSSSALASGDLANAYTATMLKTCDQLTHGSHWFMPTEKDSWSSKPPAQVCAGPNACTNVRDVGLTFEFMHAADLKDLPKCTSTLDTSCVVGYASDVGGWNAKSLTSTCPV